MKSYDGLPEPHVLVSDDYFGEHPENDWFHEVTILRVEQGKVVVRYMYRNNDNPTWRNWRDMGASFDVSHLPALVELAKQVEGDDD